MRRGATPDVLTGPTADASAGDGADAVSGGAVGMTTPDGLPRSRGFGYAHHRARPCRRLLGVLRPLGVLGPHDLHDTDAVVLGPDVSQPVAYIAAQHERIGRSLAAALLVGDEGHVGHRSKLDLFGRHLA